jgi:hypothetical protein
MLELGCFFPRSAVERERFLWTISVALAGRIRILFRRFELTLIGSIAWLVNMLARRGGFRLIDSEERLVSLTTEWLRMVIRVRVGVAMISGWVLKRRMRGLIFAVVLVVYVPEGREPWSLLYSVVLVT